MAGFLQRGVLLYLFLAIAITFAAPGVIFNSGSPADNTVLSWFDLTYDSTTGEVVTNSAFSNSSDVQDAASSFGSPTSPAGAGGILGFLDPVFQVFSWIPLIFKIIFSPILLFTHPNVNMPSGLVLIIAIPLVVLMIIGLISWIRSGLA